MKVKANIDYEREPKALVTFLDESGNLTARDIYPLLSKMSQKKVNKSFNVEEELIISKGAYLKLFPFAKVIEIAIKSLPPHLKSL